MRWMTHVNIGATLGLIAWVLWLAGQPTTAVHPITLVPIDASHSAPGHCAGPVPAVRSGRVPVSGDDL
jgi:hypothetical protein